MKLLSTDWIRTRPAPGWRVCRCALAVLLLAILTPSLAFADLPPWLPRYDLDIRLDVAQHRAVVSERVTWTNHDARPAANLVFNAHAHYCVPSDQIGLNAKTLELLRLAPSEAIDTNGPPLDVQSVCLLELLAPVLRSPVSCSPSPTVPTTTRPWRSPCPARSQNERDGRADVHDAAAAEAGTLGPVGRRHVPGPVAARAGLLRRSRLAADAVHSLAPAVLQRGRDLHGPLTLPLEQKLACQRHRRGRGDVGDGWKRSTSRPGACATSPLCSARFQEFTRRSATVRVHSPRPSGARILRPADAPHRRPRPSPSTAVVRPLSLSDFTIVESYFGWNGNECGGLVMIDERIFGMPHLRRQLRRLPRLARNLPSVVVQRRRHQRLCRDLDGRGPGHLLRPPPDGPEVRQEQHAAQLSDRAGVAAEHPPRRLPLLRP